MSNFKWKIFSNFVAFSEYPNFKQPCACEESENLFDLGNDTNSNGEPACIYEYDYSDNILYNRVMFDGSCHEIEDTEACPDSQEILPNTYGQGKGLFFSRFYCSSY